MRSVKGQIKNKSEVSSQFLLDTNIGVFVVTNVGDDPVTLNVVINSAKFSTNISGLDYQLSAGGRFVFKDLIVMSRETITITVTGGTVDYYYTIINETKPAK